MLPDGISAPEEIKEDEEMERLAHMKQRDNLVKDMCVSEQVQASLDSGRHVKENTNKISVLSDHYTCPLRVSGRGPVAAGSGNSIPLNANLHHPHLSHQQHQHPDHNGSQCGQPRRTNSTPSITEQHSSNATASTISIKKPTPPHPSSFTKKYSNSFRTSSSQRVSILGLRPFGWSQQQLRDPSQTRGAFHQQPKGSR